MSETTNFTDLIKEFTILRTFDAPRDVLWRAWTDPGEMMQWLHPRGLTTPRESVSVDLTVGGEYSYTMVTEDGDEYPTGGTYLEVVEPERLVFTWADPGGEAVESPVITVEFAERGNATEMVFHLRGMDGGPGDDGAYDGWASAFDVLVDYVSDGRKI